MSLCEQPDEILHEVIKLLDDRSVGRLGQMSHRFRKLAAERFERLPKH
jgi:hypothetical protein